MTHLSQHRRWWLGLVLGLALATSGLRAANPVMHAPFVNVGQGAATLLEFPCGAILIDTGAQDADHVEKLADYLAAFFRDRPHPNNTLSTLFITRPHIDHTRGIKRITEVCRVANYVDDGWTDAPDGRGTSGGPQVKWVRNQVREGMLATRLREVRDAEIEALTNKRGLTDDRIDPIRCPDCDPKIVILSGGIEENPGWSSTEFKNLNHSLVIRVDFGEPSFLFSGDMEVPALQTLVPYYRRTNMLDVDVMQVGHHGSYNGCGPAARWPERRPPNRTLPRGFLRASGCSDPAARTP